MNHSKRWLSAGLIAGLFGVASYAQAGPYSWEPDPPPPVVCPPNQYGVSPVVWHTPQPLVRHGIPVALQATVHFPFDRSHLDGADRAALDGVLNRIHGLNSHYGMGKAGVASGVSIVGHTDSIGSHSYNDALGLRRAQSTADYLIVQGVRPGVIGMASAGERQPIASNGTRVGRAQNRRAEVSVNALIAP